MFNSHTPLESYAQTKHSNSYDPLKPSESYARVMDKQARKFILWQIRGLPTSFDHQSILSADLENLNSVEILFKNFDAVTFDNPESNPVAEVESLENFEFGWIESSKLRR